MQTSVPPKSQPIPAPAPLCVCLAYIGDNGNCAVHGPAPLTEQDFFAARARYEAAEDAWYNATLSTLTREIMREFEDAAKHLNFVRRALWG